MPYMDSTLILPPMDQSKVITLVIIALYLGEQMPFWDSWVKPTQIGIDVCHLKRFLYKFDNWCQN